MICVDSLIVYILYAHYTVTCDDVVMNRLLWNFVLQSPYAQLLAATTLTKLVCRANITLPLEQRVEISKFGFTAGVAHLTTAV